jgi:hypothetical protein
MSARTRPRRRIACGTPGAQGPRRVRRQCPSPVVAAAVGTAVAAGSCTLGCHAPLRSLRVVRRGLQRIMLRARLATIDADRGGFAGACPLARDEVGDPHRIGNAAVQRAGIKQSMPREMDVLEVKEQGDALGHTASWHKKAPPIPEEGGELSLATYLAGLTAVNWTRTTDAITNEIKRLTLQQTLTEKRSNGYRSNWLPRFRSRAWAVRVGRHPRWSEPRFDPSGEVPRSRPAPPARVPTNP